MCASSQRHWQRMRLPKISIVTPSYQQAAFLRHTLDSILEQQYPDLELIVIDGGSTDGSVDILRAYEPHLTYWESAPDRGQAHAINKGLARASGAVLTWLNSDDVLLPGALAAVGEVFATYPPIEWLTGQPANLGSDGVLRTTPLKTGRFRGLIRRGWYHGRALGFIRQEGTFWRRELWERAGGQLDEALHYALDADLWRRFAQHADLVSLDRPLAAYREHPTQKTAQIDRYYAELGVRLPHAARWIALPLRAAFTWAAWPLSPRVIWTGSSWRYHPGRRSAKHPPIAG